MRLFLTLLFCVLTTALAQAQEPPNPNPNPDANPALARCKQGCSFTEGCGACQWRMHWPPPAITVDIGCGDSCQEDRECAPCCMTFEIVVVSTGATVSSISFCQVTNQGCIDGTSVTDSNGPFVIEGDVSLPCNRDSESSKCVKIEIHGTRVNGQPLHQIRCYKVDCDFCE